MDENLVNLLRIKPIEWDDEEPGHTPAPPSAPRNTRHSPVPDTRRVQARHARGSTPRWQASLLYPRVIPGQHRRRGWLCACKAVVVCREGDRGRREEIDEHVFSLAPMAMDEFLLTLFSRRPLTEVLAKMQQLGEDEYAILRSLQYFVSQLFLFHAYIKLHGAPDSAAILGYRLPKQLEQQRSQLAVKIPLPLFGKILDTLAEGELAMKRPAASTQKETLLLGILIKIKSFLG